MKFHSTQAKKDYLEIIAKNIKNSSKYRRVDILTPRTDKSLYIKENINFWNRLKSVTLTN